MSTTLSSLSEILRVGGWALRGIGYPFGVAERGVRLLAWTEAVGGGAVAGLRQDEASIALSQAAGRSERAGDAASGRIVRAMGRHLVELGGPAADLATLDARLGSGGHIAVRDTVGLALLPGLANLLAHRGLTAVMSYRAAPDEWIAADLPRTGWLAAGGSPEGARFYCGHDLHGLATLLQRLTSDGPSSLSPALAAAARRDVDMIRSAPPSGYLGILALRDGPLAAATLAGIAGLPDGREVNFAERFATTLREGVPMPAEDLAYLYELEMRTWAPTSERSRAQAGYGVF